MVFFEKNQKFSKHGKKIEVDLLEDSFCEKTEKNCFCRDALHKLYNQKLRSSTLNKMIMQVHILQPSIQEVSEKTECFEKSEKLSLN